MGSDGLNRILTGFYLFNPFGVRLVPLTAHDFKGFRPEFNRILTGFNGIPWNLGKIWLETAFAGVLRGNTIRGNTTRNSERKMAL